MDLSGGIMTRYPECSKQDGSCESCAFTNYGRDCRNNPVNKLAYYRTLKGMTQKDLSEKSGVNIRQIQRIENNTSDMGNVTLQNALALADALSVDVKELI